MVHCIYKGITYYNFKINIVFHSLRIDFVLANSADPDEIQHHVAFYLGLQE